jgi:hypothetical protein
MFLSPKGFIPSSERPRQTLRTSSSNSGQR